SRLVRKRCGRVNIELIFQRKIECARREPGIGVSQAIEKHSHAAGSGQGIPKCPIALRTDAIEIEIQIAIQTSTAKSPTIFGEADHGSATRSPGAVFC